MSAKNGGEIETEEHEACKYLMQDERGHTSCHIAKQDDFNPDDTYKMKFCLGTYWMCARWKNAQPSGDNGVKHLSDV